METVNVQTIMQEIRERIRARSATPRVSAGPDLSAALEPPELTALEAAVQSLDASKSLAGELPPQPRSMRGWLGGLLVKLVRRMLFWYTPQIREFQAGAVNAFNAQLGLLRTLAIGNQQNAGMLLDVQRGVEKLEQALRPETLARERLSERLEAERADREAVEQALSALARASEQLSQRLEQEMAARDQLAEKARQMETLVHHLRAENSHQSARISILLEEVRKKTATAPGALDPRLADEESHKLDAFYSAFEERFRGAEADIAEQLRFYLPWLEKHQIGMPGMPILDLGCGRGEWLSLLSAAGLEAYGVDTNRVFVAACREKGLRVTEEDALAHLRGLPDAHLGAVTGFHIIEHLPLDVLVNLIDETVRVLKPGGLAIFETPNAQNVLVGSHNFYLDPTHVRPIPCLVAQFLLEARGLCNVEILQLHPYAESYRAKDGGTELAQRFNDYFYGPQDYAVIGYRV